MKAITAFVLGWLWLLVRRWVLVALLFVALAYVLFGCVLTMYNGKLESGSVSMVPR